jgi:cytochrome c-type biogenesis protein CcmH
LRGSLLLIGVAALSIAQISSDAIPTPEVRRTGARLACLCTACNNSVGDCAMLGCHYSVPARARIKELQAQGVSDDAIIDEFVRKEGRKALIVPPMEGFSSLAWWMPPAMLGIGLVFIYWFIRRMRAPAAAPAPDPKLLDRYKDSIEKDMAKFE